MSEPESQKEDLRQFVSFVVAGEEFGVNILKVQEIIRPVDITRVPHAPEFVEGVINLRGRILPVIDLRTRFGFPERTQDDETRIIVVEVGTQTVGFMADAVQEVLRVDVTSIEPAPELAVGIDAHYLRGVAKLDERLLILLDLEGILSTDETEALEDLDADQPEQAAVA
jgi:purine-binding chemotaxis protein CheW